MNWGFLNRTTLRTIHSQSPFQSLDLKHLPNHCKKVRHFDTVDDFAVVVELLLMKSLLTKVGIQRQTWKKFCSFVIGWAFLWWKTCTNILHINCPYCSLLEKEILMQISSFTMCFLQPCFRAAAVVSLGQARANNHVTSHAYLMSSDFFRTLMSEMTKFALEYFGNALW